MSRLSKAETGISAILLFGSRARGDHAQGSDTDLLLVSPAEVPKRTSIGQVSMFYYPWRQLATNAANGDLFVCHIVREAKPIFDPLDQLPALRGLFRLRASYEHEIAQASDVGWLIDRHADDFDPQVVLRRMVWCVRTILIAKLAERGNPVFAPAMLAAMAPSTAAADILAGRHRGRANLSLQRGFRRFLASEGRRSPLEADASVSSYRAFFEQTHNGVGLQTIDSAGGHLTDDGRYS